MLNQLDKYTYSILGENDHRANLARLIVFAGCVVTPSSDETCRLPGQVRVPIISGRWLVSFVFEQDNAQRSCLACNISLASLGHRAFQAGNHPYRRLPDFLEPVVVPIP